MHEELSYIHLVTKGVWDRSDWVMFPRADIVKQKAWKSALQAMLIGHATWESVRWLEPTRCRREAERWQGQILCAIALCRA